MDEKPPFRVALEEHSDGLAVLALEGDVDIYTAPQFKQTLTSVIDAGAVKIIVDMTKVSFINSSTLGVVVGGVTQLRQLGGSLALVCADVNIARMFEITGLDRIFAVCATLETAAKALAERTSS